MYIGLHVQNMSFLSGFNKTWIFDTLFKCSNTRFHENLSNGTWTVP